MQKHKMFVIIRSERAAAFKETVFYGQEAVWMELLDIVDEKGSPTGQTVEREKAHREGIRHRSSHVWLFRRRAGRVEVLLQKRSSGKDSFPGCYDISSAGHIPAGVDYKSSAVRELREELGVEAEESKLQYCGTRYIYYEEAFYGKLFIDNQVSNVYLLWLDREPGDFVLQEEEVEKVEWFDFKECVELVRQNRIPHCIMMEELEMLRRKLDSLNCYPEGIGHCPGGRSTEVPDVKGGSRWNKY